MAVWLLVSSLVGRGSGQSVDAELDRPPTPSYYARRRHADEILASVHLRETHNHHNRYPPRSSRPLHTSLLSVAWVAILAVLLVYTIATVEVMVGRDQVDFIGPGLRETAEVLVFLIGLLVLVLVLWSVVEAVFHLSLARLEKRRPKTPPGLGGDEEPWTAKKTEEAAAGSSKQPQV